MKASNQKQLAWEQAILKYSKKSNLILLETGRSRNPQWKNSDGNSTEFFSNLEIISKIYSIDNDSEHFSNFSSSEDYCRNFLSPEALNKMVFLNGDSETIIKNTNFSETIDIVLLDSANDENIIFKEFLAVLSKTSKDCLIIVDDVILPGKKGLKVISLLNSLNISYETVSANPCGCMYFFLNEDAKKTIYIEKF
jgi:hypothetical protein